MTIEQQKAIAIASARLKLKNKTKATSPAAFDPAFESERAKQLTPDPYTHRPQRGVDIESQRPLIKSGIVNQQTLDATRRATSEFDRRKSIAESGVELNTPLPVSGVGMGFTNNESLAVQTMLTDFYSEKGLLDAKKANVRYGPVSGVLEYQDPETDKWNIVNADMRSKAGYAIPVAADIIGTTVGGMTGLAAGRGNPAVGVAGEAIGSGSFVFAAESLRLAVGRAMGWNELSTGEILSSAASEGAKSGFITLGVGGTIVSYKAFRNFIKGGGFSTRAAKEAGMSTEQAREVVQEVKKILQEGGSKKEFKPTLAQQSMTPSGSYDASIGSVERGLRSKPEYAQEFIERDLSNQDALRSLFDITNSPYAGPNKPMGSVSNRLREGINRRVNQAKQLFDGTALSLKRALDSMEDMTLGQAGKDVRPVLVAKREVAKSAYKKSYDDFNLLAGTDADTGLTGITLEVPESLKALKVRFSREAKNAMSGATVGKDKTLTFTDDAYNLSDWNGALSGMKETVRIAERGANAGIKSETNVGATKLAIRKMEAARNKALMDSGNENVLNALLKAESERLQYAQVFQKSLVGDILKFDGTGYVMNNDKILGQIIAASPEDIDILHKVIAGNPQAMQAVRKSLNELYKKQVTSTKEVKLKGQNEVGTAVVKSQRAHKTWMDSHQDVLKKFFTKEEIDGMNSLVGMSKAITKHDKKLDLFIKDAEKTWGRGKLINLDPEKIVDFVFNDSSVILSPTSRQMSTAIAMSTKKVQWLKNWMKDDPAAMDALRSNYAQRVSNAVVRDGVLNENALDDLLRNEDIVREFMGYKYVDNLKTLQSGLKMTNKQFAKLSADERGAALVQAVRGTDFAAPLGKSGRRFTAFLLIMRSENHRILKDALLNPEKLDVLSQVLKHDHVTRRTAEIAASIGLMLPDTAGIEAQSSEKNSMSR